MALAARTDEPLAEAQALATGIATAGLSRLVELGGSVLSAQLCVVAMRVSAPRATPCRDEQLSSKSVRQGWPAAFINTFLLFKSP